MGNQEGGDPKRTHTEPPRAVEERAKNVGSEYVSRILQYEWADVLVSSPPETDGLNWVPGHVGKEWGRVAPDVWSPIRARGYDPHFRHFPTVDRFDRGEFQFEFRLTPTSPGDGVDERYEEMAHSNFRERIDDYVSNTSNGTTWENASVVTEQPTVLWRATYRFPSQDSVGYYKTLRRAIEEHEWVVELAHEVLDETDA
ncbi:MULTISPECIES: hypothetical protein [Haloferax]|uniref:Uncharacterized protein n=1 Tax=Haloferax marinum TaxID=2666143 RepID=A0A6A8G9W1_9EURY|nr:MULTISPECIES: hypothetical protein [Haloferax]KAB1191108.1 hypothetical protein Hfx1150_15595 [Haloferax sp. CBA1150]MRW97989.1 hypothetical protein [Haloferax marinum]